MGVERSVSRDCPICGGAPRGHAFPYMTRFNDCDFTYLRCGSCSTVFVDPVPDAATFALMYAKADYHDRHYEGVARTAYIESVAFLSRHLRPGKRILDYGCGAGYFLEACIAAGFTPVGVEFDADEALAAGQSAGCQTCSVEEFERSCQCDLFDAVHLGDVLEHLPDPLATLASLGERLPAGGLIYVEGPLEVNPSPVYWCALLFGRVKKVIRPNKFGYRPPTHLFRTDATSQRRFFMRLGENYEIVDWRIEETGWPYSGGGLVKNAIARVARTLGGRCFLGVVFGNRFKGLFVKKSVVSPVDERHSDIAKSR